MERPLSIELLGRIHILHRDKPIPGLEPPRLRALLARLVLTPDVPVDRAVLASQFWPDSSDAQARTNLRKLVHQLARSLPRAELFLQRDTHSLQWRGDGPCRVDVNEFAKGVAEDSPPRRMLQALKLYRGPFLPGYYDEWVLAERERLHALFVRTLDRLADYCEQRGEFGPAAEFMERRLRETLHDEPAWERVIRLYAAAGNRAGALDAYSRCRRALDEELGAEPSEAIEKLYEQVRRAEGDFGPGSGAARAGPVLRHQARDAPEIPLIGRRREQADLRLWCYETLRRRRPAMMLLTGEAGIGKSRLAEDTIDWALDQGVTVAATRAYESDRETALVPVQGLLRTNPLREAASRLPPDQLRPLALLLPDAGGSLQTAPPGDEWQRRELFEALTRAVGALAGPTLLVLDDLQWWDGTSIAWLHYLLNHGQSAPLAVLATERPEEDAAAGFPELKASLQSRDRLLQIALEPLTFEECRLFVDEWVGLESVDVVAETISEEGAAEERVAVGGPDLSPSGLESARTSFADRAYAESEGNPLFLLEWLQAHRAGLKDAAAAGKHLDPVSGLPTRIHGIIIGRLLALSPPARHMADAAAVLGRAFPWQLPGSVIELDDGTAVPSLEELCRRGVLREQEDGTYDFTHARIRDVVAARLSAARRRFLHKRAAATLVAAYGDDHDAGAARLAEHYEQAGDPLKAAEHFRRAARYALSVFANEEALAMYRRGLSAVAGAAGEAGRSPSEPSRRDVGKDAVHASLWEGLGDLRLHLGHHDEARHAFARAADLSSLEAFSARSTLLRKQGNAARASQRYAEAESSYAAAEALLATMNRGAAAVKTGPELASEVEPGAAPGPTESRPFDPAAMPEDALTTWIDIQLDRLNLLYGAGRIGEMRAIAEKIGPIIDGTSAWEHRTRFHHALATMLHRRDRFVTSDETLAHGEKQLKSARAAQNPGLEAEARFALGFLLLWRRDEAGTDDRGAAAEAHLRAALQWAETTGHLLLRVRVLLYLGFLRRRHGAVDQVGSLADEAMELAERAGFNEYIAAALAHRSWVALRRGRPDKARRDARKALDLWGKGSLVYPFLSAATWPLIKLEMDEGEDEAAAALARGLLSPEQQRLPPAVETPLRTALGAWRQNRPKQMRASLRAALQAAREEGCD